MFRKLHNHWYQPRLTWFTTLLLPLSWIFQALVTCRLFLFNKKILKTHYFSIPVIVVGNLTVGGTGKTPLVIWMAQFLQKKGLRPGIVTRGVGGKQQANPRRVTSSSDPKQAGDEAVLIAKKTNCPVVIAKNRPSAVRELMNECDVIISDDGLQHYHLGRNMEVVLIDGIRKLGNQTLLPAGPLRESVQRLQKVDFIIEHAEEKKIQNAYKMQLVGSEFISLLNETSCLIEHFKPKKIHAAAAIGHPERFFNSLRRQGFDLIEHVYPDHYLYCAQDFSFQDNFPIIMTEKDAIKCKTFADERFWYLPVGAEVEPEFEERFWGLCSILLRRL